MHTESPLPANRDSYLTFDLENQMSTAVCANWASTDLPIAVQWYNARRDPACNVKAGTSEAAQLDEVTRPGVSSVYTVTRVNLRSTAETRAAALWSQAEVSLAEQNLCVAQRVAQHLEGETALFASSDDQLRLLDVVRHRAQTAVLQYTLLAKVFVGSSRLSPSTRTLAADAQYLRLLRRWLDSLPDASLKRLGDDYAAALSLHLKVTDQLGRLLRRVGSQRSPGAGIARPVADWGLDAGRTRLLRLLFGGDPFTISQQEFGDLTTVFHARNTFVATDVRSPRVGVLLGLARRADALWLRRSEVPGVGTRFNEVALEVDAKASADRIYDSVEADLRKRECDKGIAGLCGSTLPANREDYLLLSVHGIRLEDAQALAAQLADSVPSRTAFPSPSGERIYVYSGAFKVLGHHRVTEDPGSTGAAWIQLDPDVVVSEHEPNEYAQIYFPLLPVPKTLDLVVAGAFQGFTNVLGVSLSPLARLFFEDHGDTAGALNVLGLASEALELGGRGCVDRSCATFFTQASAARSSIDSAIGPRFVALRPTTVRTATSSTRLLRGLLASSSVSYPAQVTSGANASWTLDVVTTTADPLAAVAYGTGNEPMLAAASSATYAGFFGESRAALEQLPLANAEPEDVNGAVAIRRYSFDLPTAPGEGKEGVVFLKNPISKDFQAVRTINPHFSGEGTTFFATYGGSLNALVRDARRTQSQNWSMPARDGFGIPYEWIPPADVSLAGGTNGQDSVSYYLSAAKDAAQQATAAVQTAINTLKEDAVDQSALQVSEEKAAAISELEEQSLCGAAAKAGCEVALTNVTNFDPLGTLCLGEPAVVKWCQQTSSILKQILPQKLWLADAVVSAEGQSPTFAQYNGGTIQRLLINQWNALAALRRSVSDTHEVANAKGREAIAAEAALDAANGQLTQQQKIAKRECNSAAFDAATLAGKSYSDIEGEPSFTRSTNGRWDYHIDYNGSATWSPGPAIAQLAACRHANEQLKSQRLELPAQDAQNEAVISESYVALNAQYSAVSQAKAVLLTTIADLEAAANQTDIAVNRAKLEATVTAKTLQSQFALRRKYQSFDLWRARALLESARKLAVTARRAIEGRFGVDLSELNAPEAFVSAPSVWADEVYGTDLDAPSAVGLTQLTGQNAGIYPNKLTDYVNNLELFVQGYAVSRPTSVARGDSEVLTLPGPSPVVTKTIDGTEVSVLDANAAGWSFYCAQTNTWISHPATAEVPLSTPLARACEGQPPTKARLPFALDPWGRLNGDYAQPPFKVRHNARWQRLAINIVGTGIRDCAKAPDPSTCYNEPFLRYDLRHAGPAWVTNYAQEWRGLNIPAAFVESGKALTAEEWLDPVSNAWTVPLVSNVARTELVERPLGGEYQLTLELTPDLRSERIERIQVLTESNYWVSQSP